MMITSHIGDMETMRSSIHRSIIGKMRGKMFVELRTRDFSSGFMHVALRERLFRLKKFVPQIIKMENSLLAIFDQ